MRINATLFGALFGALRKLPNTAVSQSEDAADRAEEAATLAQQYGWGLTVKDGSLMFNSSNKGE